MDQSHLPRVHLKCIYIYICKCVVLCINFGRHCIWLKKVVKSRVSCGHKGYLRICGHFKMDEQWARFSLQLYQYVYLDTPRFFIQGIRVHNFEDLPQLYVFSPLIMASSTSMVHDMNRYRNLSFFLYIAVHILIKPYSSYRSYPTLERHWLP